MTVEGVAPPPRSTWDIEVFGLPVPQGSTRAFARKGKVFTTNDPTGSIEKWRGDVRAQPLALVTAGQARPWTGPIGVKVTFRFPRPKSHYLPVTAKRPEAILRPEARSMYLLGGADVDKLARAVLDALTTVCYVDDSQVVVVTAGKRWCGAGEQPGASILVRSIG